MLQAEPNNVEALEFICCLVGIYREEMSLGAAIEVCNLDASKDQLVVPRTWHYRFTKYFLLYRVGQATKNKLVVHVFG